MLEPNDRKVFFEMLRPPEPYRLEEGIATTYTLDLVTLLTAPLAFTTFEWSDAQGKPTGDPVLLLEALRRNADALTVFCQAGRAAAPARQSILYGYLEKMVVEVTARLGGVFHPKVWLLRYGASDLPPLMRLVVQSRNLTGDRSWDISLVMDGAIADRRRGFAANAPLGEFIEALPDLTVRTVEPAVQERAQRLADQARRTEFRTPENFSAYEFIPLGLRKTRRPGFLERPKRILVASPFLDGALLSDVANGAGRHVLISRLEELAKIPKEALSRFEEIYTLAENADISTEEESVPEDPGTCLSGLHAKLYVRDDGWESQVVVGSANATGAAFRKNVELLVALKGKKSEIGIDRLITLGDGEPTLRNLLIPYDPPDTPTEVDAVAEALECTLDAFRLALATAPLRALVESNDTGHAILLEGLDQVPVPNGVTASAWPITVPEQSSATRLNGSEGPLRFGPLPLAALTSFFAVAARATQAGQSLEARFVLNIPLENAPSGRREAILGTLLDDPEKFMRFLQFLLGDLDDHSALPSPAEPDAETASFGGWGSGSFVLLESLLRALKDDPRRLDYVASAVEELTKAENGLERLPKGFVALWEAIWSARQEIRA